MSIELWLFCLTPLSTIFRLYRERVLVVEETGVPEVNHWHVAIHWQALSHNVVSSTPSWAEFELTAYVVICTDCIGSCKSNNHTFMTTTASLNKLKTQNVKETNDDLQSTTQKTKEYGYRNCEIDYVTKTHPQKISYCYPSWNVCKRRKVWRNVKRICHFTVSVVYQSMICCSSRFIAKGFVSSCDTFIIYFISLFHASCDIRVHHPPLPYQPHMSGISELKWSSTMHILEVF
jgi:hypothetical protein